MARTTAYNQWLNSDGNQGIASGGGGLTKLQLTSTPLDMDRSILEAIDSAAALTGTAARYFLVQTRY